jgi:putative tryptophan/tyrosine transport system ATP-binding protein
MIDVESVSRVYSQPGGDRVLALNNLTLYVPEGQFVTVIGTNGSGKSTLLNAIAGQFQVDSGTIRIAGRDVTRQPEHARARLIGRVFQDPYKGTCPGLTIAENLRLAAQRGQRRGFRRGLGRDEQGRYAALLARFGMGLEERLEAQAGTLSGGQRQAVTLLMATISRPAILLLDEHTAALDPKAAEQIGSLTKEIVREQGLTTLMITHSMAQALALGDRTIMMHQGQIIADLAGAERRRARAQDLLDRFSALRRAEMLDDAMIRLIEANYL